MNSNTYLSEAPSIYSGFCPIHPVAKGRPRFSTKTKSTYTPRETRIYENSVRKWFMSDYGIETAPMDGALRICYEFVLSKPKSLPKRILLSFKKPDIDNLIKSFQDAMDFKTHACGIELGVISNDSRVSAVTAIKRYAIGDEKCGTWFRIVKAMSTVIVDCRSDLNVINDVSYKGDSISAIPMKGIDETGAPLLSVLDPAIPRFRLDMLDNKKISDDTETVYAVGIKNIKSKEDAIDSILRAFPNASRVVATV